MLWIALHLPLLSLESFTATLPSAAASQPIALVEAHRIVAANAAAQALGVQAGQKRATALALAPALLLGQTDEHRDRQALTSVAHAALAFTPAVSLSGSSGVVMDVQASLRYFKGLPALWQNLRDTLAPLGHQWQGVSAPTAQGAALLAQVCETLHCPDRTALQQALAAAPAWLPETAREHADSLQAMGLHTLGDVLRLPRAGLARRFGAALLQELDAALGDRPDPREPLALPASFRSQIELFARADTTEQVLHGAQVLLARLVAWLSAQHAFVRSFRLVMKHESRWRREAQSPPATTLDIALAEPSRDAGHLLVLLRERLAALQMPAPTLELAMLADDISRQPPPNGELFPTSQSEHAGLTRLIERLQARLGREQVQRLTRVEDHRPECATAIGPAEPARLRRVSPSGETSRRRPGEPQGSTANAVSAGALITRPVWLLLRGQPLQESQSQPLLEGRPLQVLAGPERIESGWWDGALAERDYFIAQTTDGALVWLYRARLPLSAGREGDGWFLQGRFG